jgi:hypothetical protein
MVYDSDLRSSPVVSIVFGDILTMYLTLLLQPPPLQYPKTAEALKKSMSSEIWKFCSGGVP